MGSAGSQVLIVAATPLLTRLYSVEAFGVFAVFMASVNVARTFACLRYDRGILLADHATELRGVTALAAGLAVGVALTSFCFSVILFWVLDFGWPEIVGYSLATGLGILCVGLLNTQQSLANRLDRQRAISASQLGEATIVVCVQILVAEVLPATGLLVGFIAGLIAANIILGMHIAGVLRGLLSEARWLDIKTSASRFQQLPLMNAPSAVLTAAASRGPPVLFAAFFGAHAAGLLGLCYRVLSGPAAVVGRAASMAILRTATDRDTSLGARGMVLRVGGGLLLLGAPVYLGIFAVGQEAFSWIFGAEWEEAGVYAEILALALLLRFAIAPLNNLAVARERHGFLLFWTATRLAVAGMSLALPMWLGMTARGALLVFAVGQVIIFLWLAGWTWRLETTVNNRGVQRETAKSGIDKV